MREYASISRYITPVPITENPLRDPKDVMVLECGLGGKAEYIITGDADLLTLGSYRGITILTPAQYLNLLDSDILTEG